MNTNAFREKGMELLEQGANTAKQQAKVTAQATTSQVTGQIPSAPKPQGTSENGSQPQQNTAQAASAQQENDKFVSDLYGGSNDPQKQQQMQQVLNPQQMAAKQQSDQQKQIEIKKHLENYYKPEVEQKIERIRQEKLQMEQHEEKVEEHQKMEELQVVEQKKNEDIALKRAQNRTEVKIGGGG